MMTPEEAQKHIEEVEQQENGQFDDLVLNVLRRNFSHYVDTQEFMEIWNKKTNDSLHRLINKGLMGFAINLDKCKE